MLSIIFGCIIANIILLGIIFGLCFYFYKKNENKIIEINNEVLNKIKIVDSVIEKINTIDFEQLNETIASVDETMKTVNEEINSLKTTILEIKEKLDSIKFPW